MEHCYSVTCILRPLAQFLISPCFCCVSSNKEVQQRGRVEERDGDDVASRSQQFVSPTQWLILFLLPSSLHSAMKIRSDVHKKSSAF